ncbi:elongation factor P [Ferrovibrio xuzhouensis]|uniref:Elongation factor P n=1 Tax=Ferrovibrio xuzhouensis TaxID=1576914 RepID=A0ABV7VFN6_9PROT
MAKVNANQLRKGNVVEINGKLLAVIAAQNIQPGKGTPVMQLELRDLSSGLKTTERYRTTESVERVFIEDREFTYLYTEGDLITFMDVENYEQLSVPAEVVGDQAVWLQDGMKVDIALYEGKAVSVTLPQTVTLEITETEPTVKGQTASSSYKPAIVTNGQRVMVPPHVSAGVRIIINIAEGGVYLERAKD